ncbi:MAG: hypothetical protein GY850_37210 [bacterium]|nr:hypothetical protein [bacterium]
MVIGIAVLLAVITLTRRFHAWRIKRAYRLIIEDLKTQGAFGAESAVKLPYARRSVSKMGIRDHLPLALDHLVFDNIVCIVEDDKYYLEDTTL